MANYGQPTTIPKPKPTDLESPVPNQAGPGPSFDEFDTGALDQAAAGPAPSFDEFAGSVDSASGEQVAATGEQVPQEVPGQITDPNLNPLDSAKQQVNEAWARFKNAFTVTDNESLQVLKDSKLFDDVKVGNDGGLIVKRKGRPTWEHFDSDKVELLGDALDLSRDAFEGIIENVGRIGGAIGGFMATAPEGAVAGMPAGAPGMAAGAVATGMGGAVPGGSVGGAVGAVTAKNAGDLVAQKLLGIKQDPNRDPIQENAQAAALGAGFDWLASKTARRVANRRATQVEAKKTMEFAQQKLAEAQADIAEVAKSGIKLGKDGKIFLDPHQVVGQGKIPELDVTAKELSKNQSFRNFREATTQKVVDAFDSVAQMIGAKAGRGATIGDDFVLSSNNVREAEGKMIHTMRLQAAEQLQGAKGVVPRTVMTVQNLISSFGKDPEKAARMQLGLDATQARDFVAEVMKLKTGIEATKGTISLDGAFAKEAELTRMINKNMNSGNTRNFAFALIELRNSVRDDALDMMEQSFAQMGGGKEGGNKLLEQFKNAKSRYRDIMEATGNLGKMLETDNLSRNEVIGKLFEGKGSYKHAMNAKTLINETHPQLWDQMTGEYFTKLRHDATDKVSGTVNWGQIAKKWDNLDPRLQTELLNTSGVSKEAMGALIRLGLRLQNAPVELVANEARSGVAGRLLKNAFVLRGGGAAAQGTVVKDLISGMGKGQAMMTWLKAGGLEEMLKEMPGMKPSRKAELRDWVEGYVLSGPSKTFTRRRAEEKVAD